MRQKKRELAPAKFDYGVRIMVGVAPQQVAGEGVCGFCTVKLVSGMNSGWCRSGRLNRAAYHRCESYDRQCSAGVLHSRLDLIDRQIAMQIPWQKLFRVIVQFSLDNGIAHPRHMLRQEVDIVQAEQMVCQQFFRHQ